jgi:hypothetical protein
LIALAFAVLIAVPLALAFIWERLTSVKVPNIVEINLADVTVQPDIKLSIELEGTDPSRLPGSGTPEILANIKNAITQGLTTELIGVNLGSGKSWWSTRLYLLVALAENYTGARYIFFEEGNDSFVGIATLTATRCALALAFPVLEQAYRAAYSTALGSPKEALQVLMPSQEAETVLYNYTNQLGIKGGEQSLSALVTKQLLKVCLQENLIEPIVECKGEECDTGHPSLLLLHNIINYPAPFVALVDDLKLKRMVKLINRQELANHVSHIVLQEQLKLPK